MTKVRSAVYSGHVVHHRHQVQDHRFRYPMYMLGLDLDEIEKVAEEQRLFSKERFNLLSFRRNDYLDGSDTPLKPAVLAQVAALGGKSDTIDRIMFLGQVRCLGWYFSPVNFFVCYQQDEPIYVLAEVSNTPWNEKHCYLIDARDPQNQDKEFHVSPFLGMDMQYHWKIKITPQRVLIHIENWSEEKLFEATLTLKQQPLSNATLFRTLKQWPMMTLSIVKGIYWQALKLFAKRVPYHSHPKG